MQELWLSLKNLSILIPELGDNAVQVKFNFDAWIYIKYVQREVAQDNNKL